MPTHPSHAHLLLGQELRLVHKHARDLGGTAASAQPGVQIRVWRECVRLGRCGMAAVGWERLAWNGMGGWDITRLSRIGRDGLDGSDCEGDEA